MIYLTEPLLRISDMLLTRALGQKDYSFQADIISYPDDDPLEDQKL